MRLPGRVTGGSTGRVSAQVTISAPKTSIPRPVQRFTLIPAALVLVASLPTIPTTVRITPYRRNRPPMIRRMSKRFAALRAAAASTSGALLGVCGHARSSLR